MARTRTYPDTYAGLLDAARDDWGNKLAAKGHSMKWRKAGRVSERTRDSTHYHGTCRNCGGELNVGEYWLDDADCAPGLIRLQRPAQCKPHRRSPR
jgi:hypothetical protein